METDEFQHEENGQWKEILGYRFRYQINADGVVRKELESGNWYTLSPYISGRTRACVKMRTEDNRKIDVPVTRLMADAFMGGLKDGQTICCRNGDKMDCSLENLIVVERPEKKTVQNRARGKSVVKLDRSGHVVAIYQSGREAARRCYISQSAIWARCAGKVTDPFGLDGFDYRYQEARSL